MSRNAARTTAACLSCHQRKRKCDGNLPCSVCSSRGLHCRYDHAADKRTTVNKKRSERVSQRDISYLTHESVDEERLTRSSPTDSLIIRSLRPLDTQPGSLAFGLKLGDFGELEYRGPTSSTIGDRLPDVPSQAALLESSEYGTAEFPGKSEMRQHLDIFVEWQNSSVLILPGSLVHHILDNFPPQEDSIRLCMVLWSILSLTHKMFGLQWRSFEQRATLSESAFQQASKLVTLLAFRTPCVEIVQSALVLSCREYSCGHENAAWVFNGIAATVGSSIGLHAGRDYDKWIASGHLSPMGAETRIIAYWALVLLDKMLGSCLGRNPLLHPSDFGTPMIKLRSVAVSNSLQEKTMTEGSLTYAGSVLQTFRFSIDLWKMADKTLSQIYIWKNDLEKLGHDLPQLIFTLKRLSNVVCTSHTEAVTWHNGLPETLDITKSGPLPHLLLFRMAFHSFQILAHRPFVRLFDSIPDIPRTSLLVASSAPSVCRSSAREILRLCRIYQQHYTLQCGVFMFAHYLTNVCTIYILDSDSKEGGIAEEAERGLEEGMDILQEMAEIWDVARNALALVKTLRSASQKQDVASTALHADGIDGMMGINVTTEVDLDAALLHAASNPYDLTIPDLDNWNSVFKF